MRMFNMCLGILFLAGMSYGQRITMPLAGRVQEVRQKNQTFPKADFFTAAGSAKSATDFQSLVNEGEIFTLDAAALQAFYKANNEAIEFTLPLAAKKNLTLELVQYQVLAEDFVLETSGSGALAYQPGLYYRGTVKGQPNSLAAISIFEDEVIGVISTPESGNMVLGKTGDPAAKSTRYIFYREDDLLIESGFQCDTEDVPVNDNKPQPDGAGILKVDKCVRAYLECEYDLVTEKGGATAATNWITGLYNVVATLYQNEQITTNISQVFTWTTPDSYSTSSTSAALTSFRNYRTTFNGDVAHLISRGAPTGGGIAWVDALCGSYAYAYSWINSTYSTFPTYSWSVECITHEMGHNLGSPHTHACAWNGNNTAIDGCGPAAGASEGCSGPMPASGTIMSYCHLVSGVGINFNNGFGPQPGAKIRTEVTNASCLVVCGGGSGCTLTVNTSGSNLPCNGAATGTATATASGGTTPYSYHWSNNANTQTITGLAAGTYSVTVTSANGCTGTATRTVTQPAALNLTTTVVNVTTGNNGSIDLTVSGGTPSYAYQWSNGANTQDIAGLAIGTYTVTVTDAAGCTAVKTILVVSAGTGGGLSCTNTITGFPYNQSFETNWGSWTQSTADNFNWSRISGATPTGNTGPNAAADGNYYIYTEATNYSPSKVAILNSPCINLATVTSPSLTFAYHMYGTQTGTLKLEASLNGSTFTTLWSRTGNQGNTWANATVSLAAYEGQTIQLRFHATTGAGQLSDMAVDNVQITGGNSGGTGCTPSAGLPHNQSFESGLQLWQQPTNDNFDWTLTNAATPTTSTGPNSAYDGSYYAFVEANNHNNQTAYLISPCFDLSAAPSPMFSFAYHLYGSTTGTLKLDYSINGGSSWITVWNTSGNQGNYWYGLYVDFTGVNSSTVKLRFSATVGNGNTSDIAIDAIDMTATGAMPYGKATVETVRLGSTAAASFAPQSELHLSPNPAKDLLNVRLFTEKEQQGRVLITDQTGRTLLNLTQNLASGENNFSLDVSRLAPGLYFLAVLQDSGERQLEKFVVVR